MGKTNTFIDEISEILELDTNSLKEDQVFRELEGWDSLKAFSLIVYLEEQLNRNVAIEEFKNLKTIGDICHLLK